MTGLKVVSLKRRAVLAAAGAALLAAGGAGWYFATRENPASRFLTAAVTRGTIEQNVTALGTLHASAGQLVEGGIADLCIFDPLDAWTVEAAALRSQGRHTPFSGLELPGRVRWTVVGGQVAYESS